MADTLYGPGLWANRIGFRSTPAGQDMRRRREAQPQEVEDIQHWIPLELGHRQYTPQSVAGYESAYRSNGGPSSFTPPSTSGSSYGYGGGGGGGGGPPAMTQAMFDAMLKAIGATGQPLDLATVNLPDFKGRALGAFNPAPYVQAMGNVNTATAADRRSSNIAANQATRALQRNYSNAYANTRVARAPRATPVGRALQRSVGGGGSQAGVAAQANQGAGSDQASFANLLNVLAAADTQSQNSRLNQVALDRATAGRNINAQALGLRGGIGMARAQAANQWQQAAAERAYQNQMMRQQWNREELMRNQDIGNQEQQGNWQQRNEMIANRLTPLLTLLQGTTGTKINTDALTKLIAQWSAPQAAAPA
jgi:hypothetical protein